MHHDPTTADTHSPVPEMIAPTRRKKPLIKELFLRCTVHDESSFEEWELLCTEAARCAGWFSGPHEHKLLRCGWRGFVYNLVDRVGDGWCSRRDKPRGEGRNGGGGEMRGDTWMDAARVFVVVVMLLLMVVGW